MMAGVGGIEPPMIGSKPIAYTSWLHPKIKIELQKIISNGRYTWSQTKLESLMRRSPSSDAAAILGVTDENRTHISSFTD